MEPAADGLRDFLEGIEFKNPDLPVISNVTAEPVTDGEVARELLVKQLTSPVGWGASVATMLHLGVDRFLELGPGKVLTTLNRRNAKGVPCVALGEPSDFDALEA
jgi:[acyl-carrier-protein] S-malonyltransferase